MEVLVRLVKPACVAAARGRVDGQRVAAVMREGQSHDIGRVSGFLRASPPAE